MEVTAEVVVAEVVVEEPVAAEEEVALEVAKKPLLNHINVSMACSSPEAKKMLWSLKI